jgi:glycosyltransferase involved in cell wall biosynthesis
MLSQFYPPFIGGEERYTQDLSRRLAAQGHDVAVATLWHEGLELYEQDDAVRVYRLKGTMQRVSWLFSSDDHRHSPPFPDPEIALALRKVIARERPQIVHAHNWLIHSFLPLKAWSGARLILHLHEYSFVCATKKLVFRETLCSGPALRKCIECSQAQYGIKGVPIAAMNWAMRKVEARLVDMFLPISAAVADYCGLAQDKLPYEIMPNFVPDDVAKLHGDNQPDQWSTQLPDGPFILYVGAFGRYKGVDVLLDAYKELGDAPPLVIIGYDTAQYPVRTSELPPNVVVLRNWPHNAVMHAWQRCLFGVVPSVWAEPFGIVAIEAMAMGKALIASRIGGLTDIVIDGETGLLVPPGDMAALRDAIKQLLARPVLRKTLEQGAQLRIHQFLASTVVPRIEAIYAQLAHNTAPMAVHNIAD